jgi:hypothetical protein
MDLSTAVWYELLCTSRTIPYFAEHDNASFYDRGGIQKIQGSTSHKHSARWLKRAPTAPPSQLAALAARGHRRQLLHIARVGGPLGVD